MDSPLRLRSKTDRSPGDELLRDELLRDEFLEDEFFFADTLEISMLNNFDRD